MNTRETERSCGRLSRARLAAFLALMLTVLLPLAAGASDSYEPNDSIPSASGPLLPNTTVEGSLSPAGDRDYFYFYVTAQRPVDLSLALANIGRGGLLSDVDLTVLDGNATPLASISFVRPGEDHSVTFSLPPQKYFVEISAREEYGDHYTLSPSGDRGGFGRYPVIAGRCHAAKRLARASEVKLSHARIRLQRAVNRLRRSRYNGNTARRAARGLYHKAKTAVREEAQAQSDAEASQRVWCVIPG